MSPKYLITLMGDFGFGYSVQQRICSSLFFRAAEARTQELAQIACSLVRSTPDGVKLYRTAHIATLHMRGR